jgi:hypothetical protein
LSKLGKYIVKNYGKKPYKTVGEVPDKVRFVVRENIDVSN